MNPPKRPGFTLVELIVVIAVLSILATIGFSAVSNVSSSARDSARLTDVSNIKTSLELYSATKGVYPSPDNVTAITWSGSLAWSQGTFGNTTVGALGNMSKPKDPKWDTDYTYSVANNRREYEVATVLEKATSMAPMNSAYAAGESYEPTIKGNYNGAALKVQTGSTIWILSVPTIIASDIKDANAKNVVLSFPKTGNLPASYSGKLNPTQAAAAFTISQVYSGSTLPSTATGYQDFATALQTAYTGTAAANFETIKGLLSQSGEIALQTYGSIVVTNGLGGTYTVNNNNNNNNNNGGTPNLTDTGGLWVRVPGNSTFGTSDFYVMKYEAKVAGGAANSSYNGHNYNSSETIISNATDIPVVNINQGDAIAACAKIGAHLVTNNEWMTMARNVESVGSNWSSGTVGNGYLYSGHNDNVPASALAASTDDTQGYINTGNSAGSNQKRTLTLSNGQVIWDLAGNLWEHVNKANTLDGSNYNSASIWVSNVCGGSAWYSFYGNDGVAQCAYQNSYTYANIWPLTTNLNAANGIGRINSSSTSNNVFLRGGHWYNGAYTGVFELYLNWDASYSNAAVGFRCAK